MTPEERANEVVGHWPKESHCYPRIDYATASRHISAAIRAAVDEARAEEREACAKRADIEETMHQFGSCAAAIRARGRAAEGGRA